MYTKEQVQQFLDFGMSPSQIISVAIEHIIPSAVTRLGMFVYGSSVYKNKTPSDIDVLVVVTSCDNIQLTVGPYNISIVSKDTFVHNMVQHDVVTLECVYCPNDAIIMPISPILLREMANFSLNLSALRESFSKTASNSYVKAKKKLIVPESHDVECSIKSMWHSFRILSFGAQLAENNTIDFSTMNHMYSTVIETYMESQCNWDTIHSELRDVYNHLATEFKLLAPKKI